MWGPLMIAMLFLFVAFLTIGGCWLMWRKAKDREQIDIEKRLEILNMVRIPPEDSARMKERIMRAIKADDQEMHILQRKQEPKEIKTCVGRCSRGKP